MGSLYWCLSLLCLILKIVEIEFVLRSAPVALGVEQVVDLNSDTFSKMSSQLTCKVIDNLFSLGAVL